MKINLKYAYNQSIIYRSVFVRETLPESFILATYLLISYVSK